MKHIKELTSLDLHKLAEEADKNQVLKVELTEQQIPFDRLGQQNPIIHFGQVYLFECDLEDSGYMMA